MGLPGHPANRYSLGRILFKEIWVKGIERLRETLSHPFSSKFSVFFGYNDNNMLHSFSPRFIQKDKWK